MAEGNQEPRAGGEAAQERDHDRVPRRLVKLVLVVPLAVVAALLGLLGIVVFVNGVAGETYDTPGLAFIIIGLLVIATAALLGALAWMIASRKAHPRIWLTMAAGSLATLVLPYIVLVVGALRGGESLWWALSQNLDIYRDSLIFDPVVETLLEIALLVLMIGSVVVYRAGARRAAMQARDS